jgi:hypothetical protein
LNSSSQLSDRSVLTHLSASLSPNSKKWPGAGQSEHPQQSANFSCVSQHFPAAKAGRTNITSDKQSAATEAAIRAKDHDLITYLLNQ